jgi:hypothetical protein
MPLFEPTRRERFQQTVDYHKSGVVTGLVILLTGISQTDDQTDPVISVAHRRTLSVSDRRSDPEIKPLRWQRIHRQP